MNGVTRGVVSRVTRGVAILRCTQSQRGKTPVSVRLADRVGQLVEDG